MGNERFVIGSVETPDEDKYTIADEWLDLQAPTFGNCYICSGLIIASAWGYVSEYNFLVRAFSDRALPFTVDPKDLVSTAAAPFNENIAKSAIHQLIDNHDVEFWPASL
jgi:hypothetical protein